MFQGEHSAIRLTFIKLPFVIKIFVLSNFEWLFYTGFTVCLHASRTYFVQIEVESQFRLSLFDLIFYIPSTIFQLNRDGSSWIEPVLS